MMGKARRSGGRGGPGGKLAFVALGCPKAMVDAECMLAELGLGGFVLTDEASQADVIVVNTCGFLEAARQEALEEIRRMARYKRVGRCRRLVVAGCLVQRDGARLREAVPEIDALVGVHDRGKLVRAALGDGQELSISGAPAAAEADGPRLRLTPRHWAYLRIGEGCSQKCTFCTIPAIRGPMRSKPPERILHEAHELAEDGAVELVLIGQETTSYGDDIGYAPGLGGLLRELERVDGVRWVRLMYAYPLTLGDSIMEAIGECGKVVKYVDLPIQHIDERMLRAMGRRMGRAQTQRHLERLRERVPGVAIRTTVMVGFPGETDQEFAELVDFVEAFRFEALGGFAFSAEAGTAAAAMPGQIPEPVKQERLDQLMRTQQRVAFALAAARRGERFAVLIDEADRKGVAVGRHGGQAPEVDAITYVQGGGLRAGQFVQVECVGSREYDLLARRVDEEGERSCSP